MDRASDGNSPTDESGLDRPTLQTMPIRRLAAAAASADPMAITAFHPTSRHHAVVGALFHSDEPLTSFKSVAVAAGITIDQMYLILEDPAACNWIISHSAALATAGLAAVYARLLHQSLKSNNPNWMSMFLKRFDPEYAKAEAGSTTNNIQVNSFRNYTTEELLAFVRQKKRLKLGAEAEVL